MEKGTILNHSPHYTTATNKAVTNQSYIQHLTFLKSCLAQKSFERTSNTFNIRYIVRLENSLNNIQTGNYFYLQQDLKFYNKKALETISLVKGLKEKEKKQQKPEKVGREGQKKMVCQ